MRKRSIIQRFIIDSIITKSLNSLRNKLIASGRYADAVDELIVRFAKAPIKKFKIKRTEGDVSSSNE